jgi:hypothetical protein
VIPDKLIGPVFQALHDSIVILEEVIDEYESCMAINVKRMTVKTNAAVLSSSGLRIQALTIDGNRIEFDVSHREFRDMKVDDLRTIIVRQLMIQMGEKENQ